MKNSTPSYHGFRFPPELISHAVWLYHRFCLSFRDVEDLLAERGITVTYETIRQWCRRFGPGYARRLKRRQGRLGDSWHLNELFVTIRGRRQYLWRAVDQDGDVIDILVQPRRDRRAAERFFRKLLKGQGREPISANNRAEVSHEQTRQRERQMRRFRSAAQAQRFLSVHGIPQNLFRVGRHLLRAANHRMLAPSLFGTRQHVPDESGSGADGPLRSYLAKLTKPVAQLPTARPHHHERAGQHNSWNCQPLCASAAKPRELRPTARNPFMKHLLRSPIYWKSRTSTRFVTSTYCQVRPRSRIALDARTFPASRASRYAASQLIRTKGCARSAPHWSMPTRG